MTEKLNSYKEYCEREFRDFTRTIDNGWDNVIHARNCGLQRCLGVADFLQIVEDIPFDDINKIYEEYRHKFYAIEKGR